MLSQGEEKGTERERERVRERGREGKGERDIETQPEVAKATKRKEICGIRSLIILPLHFKQTVIVGLANKLCLNYRPLGTINKGNQFHKNLNFTSCISFSRRKTDSK